MASQIKISVDQSRPARNQIHEVRASAGKLAKGFLQLKLFKIKKAIYRENMLTIKSGLKVKLRGEELNIWSEIRTYITNGIVKPISVRYSGENTFLEVDVTLLGNKPMAVGRYEYPFTFILPKTLPVSFQGAYGYIKYHIKASVDIPLASDYEDIKPFNVEAPIDFNKIRSELPLAPSSYQDEKTICCWCCASGPIELNVHLEKESFVLGEMVKVKIDVKNMSNKNIERLDVTLKSVIKSKATSPCAKHKSDSELLVSKSDSGVRPHGERIYDIYMEIPTSAALYNFTGSSLFEQSFPLKVKACLAGYHSNLVVKADIVLGHIPLEGANSPSTYLSQETSSDPSMSESPVPSPPTHDSNDVEASPTNQPDVHSNGPSAPSTQ